MLYYYYTITNKNNGKQYCGITKNYTQRINKHKRELLHNCHHSIKLQNAFNKHGSAAFVFKLEYTKDFNTNTEAYAEEINFIKMHNSYVNGYNMTPGGLGTLGEISSLHTQQTWQQKVPNIYQIDINTLQIVKVWNCLREIERELHIAHQNISRVCKRTDISQGGYYWCYEDDWSESWIPPLNQKYKPIALIDQETQDIVRVFQSCADAGRQLNLRRENIRDAILRDGTCGKQKFVYINKETYEKYACRD